MKKPQKTVKIKKAKKMSIEDLAIMVARSFENIPTRDEMNARFDQMRTEFNVRFDEAAKENKDQFDEIKNILIRALDNRTTKLEDDTRVIKTTLENMSRV